MTDSAHSQCERGLHVFPPPPPPEYVRGVEPDTCQCGALMLSFYRDNGQPFVSVVFTVEAAP